MAWHLLALGSGGRRRRVYVGFQMHSEAVVIKIAMYYLTYPEPEGSVMSDELDRRKSPIFLISELARILHRAHARFKGLAVFSLSAYFDETGTDAHTPLVMIAGVIASAKEWQELEDEWLRLLGNLNIEWFHATECNAGRGAFARLSKPIRDDLVRNLANVIAKYTPEIVNAAIFREDWNQYKEGLERVFGHPYHMCFESCLFRTVNWSRTRANGEPVAFVFAQQEEYVDRAEYDVYRYMRNSPWKNEIQSVTFTPAKNRPALQVADFVAYELRRYFQDKRTNPDAALRPAMQIFMTKLAMFGWVYEVAQLPEIIEIEDRALRQRQLQESGLGLNLLPFP